MEKCGWVSLNEVPTLIRTWGTWIEDDFNNDSVILLITGNPGVTDFYKKFASKLHDLTNIPVWLLGHAGCHRPPTSRNMPMPKLKSNPELYNLNGQIKHKEDFMYKYIPKTKKVYLIGHSIGAKICIELMKNGDFEKIIEQAYLICPTLQYIGETPNGVVFRRFLSRIAPVLIMLSWIFTLFPFRLQSFLVYGFIAIYSMSLDIEPCCINGIIKIISPEILKVIFFFANDEMAKVKKLDDQVYEKNYKKINAYYGQTDKWAPLYQYEDLKKKYPQINCTLLHPSIKHSFVFKSSVKAAAIMAEEIKRCL